MAYATYIAAKPYVLAVKDGKIIHKANIRIGGAVVVDATVTFYDTEAAWRTACLAVDPKAFDTTPPKK